MHERRVTVAYAAALIMMLSAAVVLPQQARAQLGLPLLGSLVVTSPAAGSTVSGTRTVSASVSIIGGSSLMRLKSPSEGLPCAALPAL